MRVYQEEWAVHFSDMLAVNSSLLELHLGTTGMTDTGMERLSEGLRLNHSLRYLDLRWYEQQIKIKKNDKNSVIICTLNLKCTVNVGLY